MQTNIVDVAGGTFVITAISYSTGVGYYNSLFKSINGKSDLFSVSLERILFEGGRQLAFITFYPILIFVLAVLVVAILHVLFKRFGYICISQAGSWVRNLEVVKVLARFNVFLFFLATVSYASYAFYTAGKAGEQYMSNAECLPGKITTERGDFDGCVLFKTDAEIWIAVKEKEKSVLLNIPSDKYLSMRIF
ncbi:hypothetical protein [Pseudomonas cannabina]|uniref:Uncharacterized protein n=1 Tax=Pseudomonas cannabina pv. alisalensis TaxID=757414 RepID=A0ABS1XB24_PSEC1|nr:hypothetical protein [Pseudomonas cannabina]MBM0138649.1 hypothetical protein [Pseudomonas cannabina pv. alisalensis]